MDLTMLRKLEELSTREENRENTIQYLAEHLGKFLKPRETIMLAFREHKVGNISWLMEQAALRIDAGPLIWGPDHRWSTLLRQTYLNRASVVIGSPQGLLGLMKLSRYNNTPLPIRKAVTSGFPCPEWVIDGIARGLDCQAGGCFGIGESGIVAGFACGHSWGVHLRRDVYGVDILDDWGNPTAPGQMGQIVLYPVEDPSIRCYLGDWGRACVGDCECGSDAIRLTDLELGHNVDRELYELEQQLLQWTSILDCRLSKGESGLEMEILCFAGEKLPKIPSAAKLVVKAYNPKTDEPYWYIPGRMNSLYD